MDVEMHTIKNDRCLQGDGTMTMCSKYDDHFRFDSGHDCKRLIRSLNEYNNLHFDDERDVYRSLRKYEANDDYGHDLDLQITNCVFRILQEVGAERKLPG